MNGLKEGSFNPVQCYSSEQWEQKRTLVTRLYRDEAKTLHSVRLALAQENFRPTEAMLKKRIKKWDLDRNHKHADMLHALTLAWNRRKEGKETNFLIRERLVTFPEVQNYFRRKGIRNLESLAADALDAKPTTRIECCTPRISTLDEDSGETDSFNRHKNAYFDREHPSSYFGYHARQDVVILPEQPQLIDKASLTAPLNHLNSLLHLNRNYFNAMVEHPDWRTESAIFDMKILEQFYHHMVDGQSLVTDHLMVEGFKCFNQAFDLVRGLLRSRTVLLMPYIYHFVATGRYIEFQDVKGVLLDFVASMASQMGESMFPICHSSGVLRGLSPDERVEYSKRVLGCILDRLKQSFEGDRPTEDEICSDAVCDYWQKGVPVAFSMNNAKLVAIAVWKLDEDIGDVFNLGDRVIHWEKHSSGAKSLLPSPQGESPPKRKRLADRVDSDESDDTEDSDDDVSSGTIRRGPPMMKMISGPLVRPSVCGGGAQGGWGRLINCTTFR